MLNVWLNRQQQHLCAKRRSRTVIRLIKEFCEACGVRRLQVYRGQLGQGQNFMLARVGRRPAVRAFLLEGGLGNDLCFGFASFSSAGYSFTFQNSLVATMVDRRPTLSWHGIIAHQYVCAPTSFPHTPPLHARAQRVRPQCRCRWRDGP